MTEATAPKLHRNIYYFESGPNLRNLLADANGLKRGTALPPYMYMLWLEPSGAEARTRQKSTRGSGAVPVMD